MRWHIILSRCWRSSHETPVCVCFAHGTVRPPCENLQFAQRIGITHTGSTISSRFDAVLVDHWRCQVSEIRSIDYLRMKRDLREEHAQEKADKAQAK
jgi:hypothetical protein